MPALVNACANLILGSVVAYLSRRSEAMRAELLAWPLLFLLAFQALVITPLATYLFRFYPQWSMLYWFDPQIFPRLDAWVGILAALAVVSNSAAMVVGYATTRWALLKGPIWVQLVPIGAAAVAVLLMLWQFWERILFVGDYDAFWRGEAVLLFKSPPGWAGIALYAVSAGFVLWLRARYRDREPSFFET